MSDSESENNSNLSELEEEDAVSVEDKGSEEDETKELKGILNDVEETDVQWSDLVKIILSTCFFCNSTKYFISNLGSYRCFMRSMSRSKVESTNKNSTRVDSCSTARQGYNSIGRNGKR